MTVTRLQHCSYVHEIERGKNYAYCYNLTAWLQYGVPICGEHLASARAQVAAA